MRWFIAALAATMFMMSLSVFAQQTQLRDDQQDTALRGFGKSLAQNDAVDARQDAALRGFGAVNTSQDQKIAFLETLLQHGGAGSNVATKEWVSAHFQSISQQSLSDIYLLLGVYTNRTEAVNRVREVISNSGARLAEDKFRAVFFDVLRLMMGGQKQRAVAATRATLEDITTTADVDVAPIAAKYARYRADDQATTDLHAAAVAEKADHGARIAQLGAAQESLSLALQKNARDGKVRKAASDALAILLSKEEERLHAAARESLAILGLADEVKCNRAAIEKIAVALRDDNTERMDNNIRIRAAARGVAHLIVP